VLLHNQWSLRPAGQQIDLGDFPVNIAVHPAGRYAAVLHCGYGRHQIRIVDLPAVKVVQTQPVREAFYGLSWSADGKNLFCSGASDEVIRQFGFEDGKLKLERNIKLRDPAQRAIPAGLAVNRDGSRLFAANVWAHRLTQVNLGTEPVAHDILLGTNVSAIGTAPTKPSADFDQASIEKRAEARLYPSRPEDTFPYTCVLDEARNVLYVSLWAQSAVAVLDLASEQVIALWHSEDHPCEMVLSRSGHLLYVANANRNTVTVFDTREGKPIETIWAALYPQCPPGSTPNSLALSPDEKLLFVANADNNMVAVFNVEKPRKTRSLGFIPVGWYPTSVRVTPDGKTLLVANGRGTTPKANPKGPRPGVKRTSTVEYIGGLYAGTLSVIPIGEPEQFERDLARYTADAYRCAPLTKGSSVSAKAPANSPVPSKPGGPTPIKYCLYVVKENRTYDQMLGDMPEGNGDPTLCLFPERVTPNHHQLAREFGLLDNFYVNSEVSADGHEWSMGAYASDFVKKSWPMSYGHNKSGKYPYPSEGGFAIAAPASGYLWDRAREAGVTYHSFGEWIANGRTAADPGRAKAKSLEGHFDPWYRSFDTSYPDAKRADRYIAELKRFESEGEMPRLQIIRLPNDHTSGATAGTRTPTAHVADNDLALGRIVEAVSNSKFWPQTAIFILEDDAQNGPDHIDAHRSIAYVISPYSKRGSVISTMYSTTSMLRTIELILGIPPMSQYDAAARPMYNCFQAKPDLRPYKCVPVTVDMDEKNLASAWGSDFDLDLDVEDAADDLLLNEVVWKAVKGRNSQMPAPVRAAFVMAGEEEEDED
jgi:DNA-binding beta-propeller fold protein YncE